MKIAFISTRGIPNNYGGFEQFAEYISVGLVARGHDVTVYCPKFHPYQKNEYKGVRLKHFYSPEKWMGASIGSFFYDFVCFRDAIKKENFDIIYEAGYTSIIPAFIWYNVHNMKSPIVTTNMDGLEYKRTKFNPIVRHFLLWEEKKAVYHSHHIIADNLGIQDYYKERYNQPSTYLAYGADIHSNYSVESLVDYKLEPYNYYILVARMEPENNVEMVIQGYIESAEYKKYPLMIVGNLTTKFGKYLNKIYGKYENVRFIGGVYDFQKLNSLRHFSKAYFHGHSVGGTNPSLLEAMASGCFIISHQNIFNKTVLGDNALFFDSAQSVTSILDRLDLILNDERDKFILNNLQVIKDSYSWNRLVKLHEEYFEMLLNQGNHQ